ncbi:Eco57I restriction-modification methylase domain-containing protein [Tissierella sp.]|uniref:Eco57I restriction-modification methylase domain-containing protein n=1 Tax=Tissierella sp. TaxID=41274 RepID=UPI00285F892A|nr:N-6 DNA methylase [Tissierella sp.]MDR7857138.1 N-6 DNA methylase [Tissierella sp.]
MEHSILGEAYESSNDKETRKAIGQYYTPGFIIEYILENTMGKADIVKNPFISIIDISCGAGYFLMMAYDILKEKFELNIDKLRDVYRDDIYIVEKNGQISEVCGNNYWKAENIHYHILTHCIYGADKDNMGVELTKIGLLAKNPNIEICHVNVLECDSLIRWEAENIFQKESQDNKRLMEFWSKKYDYVIGNPPYIGHKQLDLQYKEWLLKEYGDVFKDKSDISFCFFKRINEILTPDGICGIITSRYFMESPTGRQLRSYLQGNVHFIEILDFYGAEVFKGIGVATAIYIFKNSKFENNDNEILVHKLLDDGYRLDNSQSLGEIIKKNIFERFKISQSSLDINRWVIISNDSLNIYIKIQRKTKYRLGDIAKSFQGVITGCDKAFILTQDMMIESNIEKNLLKKWVKNKNVRRYQIVDTDLYLIYSDLIQGENDYPYSIGFIRNYRQRLENRRECKNGIRKWYELQWGREMELFEQPKILFPYKAGSNRFALDYNNVYCSADVYSIIIKNEYRDKLSLEYLVGLLNSSIYEFYFKLYAKKIGKGMYDYYPNSVLDMMIITEDIIDDIEARVRQIMELLVIVDKDKETIDEKINILEREIDEIIAAYLGINENEINYIKGILNRF